MPLESKDKSERNNVKFLRKKRAIQSTIKAGGITTNIRSGRKGTSFIKTKTGGTTKRCRSGRRRAYKPKAKAKRIATKAYGVRN